ncbi:MAG TPA: hypothetical protein VKS21_14045, partial [Spirochaetota bacterium]|nr:hypothetical protein [Spirochaetota bacterium]
NHLNSAEQDRCLWLYKKLGYKIISKKDGLTGNAVSSLLFDGDDLWIGTWLNGLNRYNLSLNEITPYKALKNNFIANTVRDIKLQDRFIWIATFDGLTRFNINTEKYKDFSGIFYDPDEINKSNPRIKALEIDNNRLYIASLGKGLRIFYTTANKWEVFRRSTGFFDNYLTCLALYDNKLFVGSMRRGAAVVDIKNKNYTVINNAYQYTGRNIRDLYADTDYIIIATKNYGLYILDHNYKILAHINMDNYPIMSNYFTSIERKGNMIYCGTMGGGLIIINQRGFTVKTKTVINGLASDSIMSVKYKRGFVWLGTVDKGVIRCLVRN